MCIKIYGNKSKTAKFLGYYKITFLEYQLMDVYILQKCCSQRYTVQKAYIILSLYVNRIYLKTFFFPCRFSGGYLHWHGDQNGPELSIQIPETLCCRKVRLHYLLFLTYFNFYQLFFFSSKRCQPAVSNACFTLLCKHCRLPV